MEFGEGRRMQMNMNDYDEKKKETMDLHWKTKCANRKRKQMPFTESSGRTHAHMHHTAWGVDSIML